MAERSEKQDQDELQNDKERNLTPRTASIVDCNCITMCQDADDETSMGLEIKKLMDVLKSEDNDKIEEYLKDLPNLEHLNDCAKRQSKGESLLHLALKFKKTNTFVRTIIRQKRSLLMEQRSECYMKKKVCQSPLEKLRRIFSTEKDTEKERSPYEGQTPLHVAIAKGNYRAVKIILKESNEKETQELLSTCAVGKEFKNTVLMGQLPLSVAALAFKDNKFRIVKHLLKRKAKIWNMNEKGDTVFHSLIKYADVYPDKILKTYSNFYGGNF